MDSRKILSIFFFVSFVILSHHQSQARILINGFPEFSPSPAPSPSSWPCSTEWCCHNESLTAWIDHSPRGSKKWLVSLKNDGEQPVNVTVTSISHGKPTIQGQGITVSGDQVKEVNISANLGANSSILVDAGKLGCVINITSMASHGGIFGDVPFGTYMTPSNGAYFLFLTGLVLGTLWAYHKWGKSGQHGDGISYQQLEMGQVPDSPSADNVETAAESWEQDWDGDWDELKSKVAKGSSANALTSRTSNRDGHDD